MDTKNQNIIFLLLPHRNVLSHRHILFLSLSLSHRRALFHRQRAFPYYLATFIPSFELIDYRNHTMENYIKLKALNYAPYTKMSVCSQYGKQS